ncbi:WD40 repeat domain-containing protein [Campylobacter corcagiensis]|uniref:WD40 repeat domain-containing protein n=1 Tax=Campylobacter corcagiensis TaxID=1448857 RepID=A0A7M1LED3_9BACT|nr:WD40 repeat domain-containing protein [Campylobacter corcagiensis]QKF64898.1 nitrate reductase accessory protein [Campylobacter corcagiensis]QOQ86942.1 WD40 repeat domain-containing protein [Campylobacter corcagiensis]
MRNILVFLLFFSLSFSANLVDTVETKHNVLGLNLKDNLLIISTDGGELIVHNMESNSTLIELELKYIETFFGDFVRPRVLSGDIIGKKVMMLGESDFGKKALYFYENDKIEKQELKYEGIKKALFLDENLIVLASMSNEIYFYDINKAKVVSQKKFSTASLSDMEVKNGLIFVGCESGIVYVYDITNDDTTILPLHKDNIYDIEISDNFNIISGGVDKHAVLYVNSKRRIFESEFLVYAVGLNSNGSKAAIMSSEDSDVVVFNTDNLDIISQFNTGQSILNGVKFYGSNLLITSAYEKNIKIWEF